MEKQVKCPSCGSENVKFNLRSAGTVSSTSYYRTGIKSSWFIPSGQKTHKSSRKHKVVCVCQDCGYLWDRKGQPSFLSQCVSILMLLFVLFVVFKACSGIKSNIRSSELESSTDIEQIWATEYTPLEEFEYYIDDGEIYLKGYDGKSETIYIASSYMVDGDREMPIAALEGSHYFSSRTKSVIISEGIRQISNAVFNGCGAEYLYFPQTLEAFSGWSYFHSVDKIYFGGSEVEWKELCTIERSRLDVVEVICNASIDNLP